MKSLRSNAGIIVRSGAALFTLAAMMGLLAGCMMTAAPHPLVGTWSIAIEAGGEAPELTLTVANDLTGAFTSPDSETPFQITEVVVEGNAVSFKVVFNVQGQEIPASFKGTVEGDVLEGELDTDFGLLPMTGKRM